MACSCTNWVKELSNEVKVSVSEVALHPFKYLSIEFNSPIIFSKILFTKVIVVAIDDIVFCALVILGVILANTLFNESKETKSAFPGSGEPGVVVGIAVMIGGKAFETESIVFTAVEVIVTTLFKGSTIFFNWLIVWDAELSLSTRAFLIFKIFFNSSGGRQKSGNFSLSSPIFWIPALTAISTILGINWLSNSYPFSANKTAILSCPVIL